VHGKLMRLVAPLGGTTWSFEFKRDELPNLCALELMHPRATDIDAGRECTALRACPRLDCLEARGFSSPDYPSGDGVPINALSLMEGLPLKSLKVDLVPGDTVFAGNVLALLPLFPALARVEIRCRNERRRDFTSGRYVSDQPMSVRRVRPFAAVKWVQKRRALLDRLGVRVP
jgi:hypothetical protein